MITRYVLSIAVLSLAFLTGFTCSKQAPAPSTEVTTTVEAPAAETTTTVAQ